MKVQFGANPGIQRPPKFQGSDKATRNLVQGFVDLNEARTPKQADKAVRKVTRGTLGLAFSLIGEGLLDMIKSCFR